VSNALAIRAPVAQQRQERPRDLVAMRNPTQPASNAAH
jgi:hypothetical protein